MALVNHAKKEINAKIVYFGAAQAGKATNLNFIFKKLKPDFRGQFKSMNVQGSKMLFFDFLPSGQGKLNDYAVRFHIYTVQGDVPQDSTWKMVLKGVDGVVFVADASSARQTENHTSLERLQTCLRGHGLSTDALPIIVQCNKSDLADAVSTAEMQQSFGLGGGAFMKAAAGTGEGVLECLFTLVKMVLKRLRESGLELAGEAVEGTATEAEEVAGEQSIPAPIVVLPAAESSAAGSEETPSENAASSVEILEGVHLTADGHLQVPLSIRCGNMTRRMVLNLAVSLEAE
ncbi:ATP/GTP-binding protein [Geobacter sp. AOG1]|uniref:GTP-binding protein n=1 Tax=Geobacter sp. AOG1 TaxID=1566346 RepID=UPI001CC3AB9F|nr:ADP-ribosylation factor-like protein [Geobacter sp. AOG1]GFE58696.1 GTP-binding protein [Geobacter sp. AOG1]